MFSKVILVSYKNAPERRNTIGRFQRFSRSKRTITSSLLLRSRFKGHRCESDIVLLFGEYLEITLTVPLIFYYLKGINKKTQAFCLVGSLEFRGH